MADDILDLFKSKQSSASGKASKKLRVGIIGTGGIAGSHIREYKKMPDVEIVCGADIVEGKAKKFFENWEVPTAKAYTDFRKMIDTENLDAVSVCTYNRAHTMCTVYALEHGVNVLLEKPMCVTMDEAAEICRAEKKSGKILSLGFQPRFDDNMRSIKKIVDSGILGDIYYIQTGGGRRHGIPVNPVRGTSFIAADTGGIGAIGDIGCYSLDMVLNAIGYPKPLTVTGYMSNFFGTNPSYYAENGEKYAASFGVDDFAAGFIRLEGGIILDFRIAWAMHLDTPGDTIIMGKKGSLRIPSTNCWNGSIGGAMTIYREICGSQTETMVEIFDPPKDGIFYGKVRSFLDAVINDTKPPVPTEQIIINQAIICGIVDSAKIGKEVKIELPEI